MIRERTERRLWAYEHFRSWLAMLATNHSLRQIGLRAGVDYTTLSRIIQTGRPPSLVTARKLIDTYIP